MKRQVSVFGIFVLALGALATQSCESTVGQNANYNQGKYGYSNLGYVEDNGYYNEGHYADSDYQRNRPAVDLHF